MQNSVNNSKAESNKAIVLEAFETLFNKRDYAAAERFWSPTYIQHSAHIEPGRDGLFNLIRSTPPTLKYEPGIIVAEGDFVIIHGRFSDIGRAMIATDIIRMKDGVLLEHWDINTFAFGETKPEFFSPMTSPKNSPSPTCILE